MQTKIKKTIPYPNSKTVDMFDWIVVDEKDPLDLWETKEEQYIPIKNLREQHLLAIVDFFKKHPGWRLEQQPRIYAEIERRKKLKLIKNTKAGNLFYGNDC